MKQLLSQDRAAFRSKGGPGVALLLVCESSVACLDKCSLDRIFASKTTVAQFLNLKLLRPEMVAWFLMEYQHDIDF